MSFTVTDRRHMQRALDLARRGLGRTSPNPAVGAVLVRAGRIIGEGWHRAAGQPHAEIEALRDVERSRARGRARTRARARVDGATLYVTLEPCSTHGRTPPCTAAILTAGIGRVVVAATDPNPRHRGRGLKLLRRAGVRIDAGLLTEEATALNAAFNKWITTGLPLVTAKIATSLDGKVATRTRDSQWITGPVARREGHKLRAVADGILVSAGTVVADNPRLTVRHGVRGRQPWRVVVDARGRAPLSARLFTDAWCRRTIVFTTRRSPARWRQGLACRGVAVYVVPATPAQHADLGAVLRELGRLELTSVLVEGGGELLGALMAARLVDRLAIFYAPLLIGGRAAVPALGGAGVARVAEAPRLREVCWKPLSDGSMLVRGRL